MSEFECEWVSGWAIALKYAQGGKGNMPRGGREMPRGEDEKVDPKPPAALRVSGDELCCLLCVVLPAADGSQYIGGEEYLVMDNLTAGYRQPCILDVKVGLHTRSYTSQAFIRPAAG